MLKSGKITEIREKRVAAIKHPQFHLFPGTHITDHLHASRFPCGTTGDKVVFNHPLNERFTADRARIGHAQFAGDFSQRVFRGGRHNAVDHRGGKADMLTDPACQCGRAFFRHPKHGVLHDMTVIWNVVAGKHRERCQPARLST